MAKKRSQVEILLARAKKISLRLDSQLSNKGKTANQIANEFDVTKDKFLLSPEWKIMRRKVIEHYGAKCMKCNYVPSNLRQINVDHIKPRVYFPHLALDFDNLQVLCCACNKEKGNKNQADYRPK